MAKNKPPAAVNVSAEVRKLTEANKDAPFKTIFEQLQKRFHDRKFKESSALVAWSRSRVALGLTKRHQKEKGDKPALSAPPRPAPTPVGKSPARPATQPTSRPTGRPTPPSVAIRAAAGRGGANPVVDAMTTAQRLIALCGSKEAAKHVIDNVEV